MTLPALERRGGGNPCRHGLPVGLDEMGSTLSARRKRPRSGVAPRKALCGMTSKREYDRQLKAALLNLAAKAELATPASERWIVQIDDAGNELGYVYIELSEGSDAEAKRGLAQLKRIAG